MFSNVMLNNKHKIDECRHGCSCMPYYDRGTARITILLLPSHAIQQFSEKSAMEAV